MRAECTIRALWRRATFAAGLLVCAGAPTWAQVDTIAEADTPARVAAPTDSAGLQINPEGHPIPSLAGFVRVKERDMRLDTDASRPGEETLMEAFLGPDSTAIGRLSTGGIVWAYGITPGGRVADSYFILDADCSGKFAQKLPPTAQFGPPPCAQRAAAPQAATGAAPSPALGLPQHAPADTSAAIVEVGLSAYATSDLPRNAEGVVQVDPARVGTEFGADTRHLLVSFRWEGAPPGSKVDLHWFHECQRIVEQNHVLMGPTGHALGGLAQPGTPILPPGGYRVEIFENGKRVTTIPFRIGTAAPANAAHGSPECVTGSR